MAPAISGKTHRMTDTKAKTAREDTREPGAAQEDRLRHNAEHVPEQKWARGCYFCSTQKDGGGVQGPVEVPGEPPVEPDLPG